MNTGQESSLTSSTSSVGSSRYSSAKDCPLQDSSSSSANSESRSTYASAKSFHLQKQVANFIHGKMDEAIAEKLDPETIFSSSRTFRIANLGRSIGHDTFLVMQNIQEAIDRKYQAQTCPGSATTSQYQKPEFQVFFEQNASTDFNILFTSFPTDRPYHLAGVPGSSYGRLFPESYLHFVYCSNSLQWLSKVPEDLLDVNSPAWNKGRIHYTNAGDEVVRAYKRQFCKDLENFLEAREKEMVAGGMMVLVLLANPIEVPHFQTPIGVLLDLLESSILDMAKEEEISEDQVDSFNLPLYASSPEEITELVEKNGRFTIEKIELISPGFQETRSKTSNIGQGITTSLKVCLQGAISKHFGGDIIDRLFDRYLVKIEEFLHRLQSSKKERTQLFLVLRRR